MSALRGGLSHVSACGGWQLRLQPWCWPSSPARCPGAQAHAFLARSNPADGQVLAAAPAQLRLGFSESVVLAATQIDVVDGSGRHITPSGLTLAAQGDQDAADANAGQDTEEPVEVVAALPTLGRGSYRISWETLSSDDLHRTSGVLVFGVGQTVTAGGLDQPAPPPLEAGLRWLVLLGLSGALGGALAGSLLRRGGEGAPHPPGAVRAASLARRWSVGGAVAAATAALVLLVTRLRPRRRSRSAAVVELVRTALGSA